MGLKFDPPFNPRQYLTKGQLAKVNAEIATEKAALQKSLAALLGPNLDGPDGPLTESAVRIIVHQRVRILDLLKGNS